MAERIVCPGSDLWHEVRGDGARRPSVASSASPARAAPVAPRWASYAPCAGCRGACLIGRAPEGEPRRGRAALPSGLAIRLASPRPRRARPAGEPAVGAGPRIVASASEP